jgi:hypothetical protein
MRYGVTKLVGAEPERDAGRREGWRRSRSTSFTRRARGGGLGGGGGVALHRETAEESGDLGGPELARVAAGVEGDEGADPVEVGLLGAGGVVEAPEGAANGIERVIQRHRRGPGESYVGEPQKKW